MPGGPHVQIAAICEKVLQEGDGILSLIRVVDRITITARGDGPDELPQGTIDVTLVVSLKADDARGRYPLILRLQQPAGNFLPDRQVDVMFEGDERGVNVISPVRFDAIEGLHWFEVEMNGKQLSRIPLRIMYQRVPGVAGS